ncbi:hypothetical protein KY284_027361 [Solanum tuberosum]|nr:hypothetical protein KY284_027361 [Solanum tuberosum]
MELPNLVFFISLIFFWFFIKPYLYFKSSKKLKLPPGPTGLPIIGSRPNQSLAKIHGPLMTLKLGSITTVIASSPETAKEILQKRDKTFSVPDAVASQPNHEATIAWVPPDNLPKGMTPENLDMEEQFGVTLRKAIPLVAVPNVEKK